MVRLFVLPAMMSQAVLDVELANAFNTSMEMSHTVTFVEPHTPGILDTYGR